MNETLEKLEQRCDELTKQYEDVKHILEQERRKHERIHESSNVSSSSVTASSNSSIIHDNSNTNESVVKATIVSKESTMRHIGSASEPENDEVFLYME